MGFVIKVASPIVLYGDGIDETMRMRVEVGKE